MPEVSIITTAHNAERYIDDAIDSVINQTFSDFEWIVVDDCSSDDTLHRLASVEHQDRRLRVFSMAENGGPARGRNFAMSKASSRYLCFLDADDVWFREKLANQIAFMKSRAALFSYHDYVNFSQDATAFSRPIHGPARLTEANIHYRRGIGFCLTTCVDIEQAGDFLFPEVSDRVRNEDYLAFQSLLHRTGGCGLRLNGILAGVRLSGESRSARKLYKASTIWRVYRDVERLPLPRRSIYYLGYATSATWWRAVGRPRYPVGPREHSRTHAARALEPAIHRQFGCNTGASPVA